MKKKEVKNKKYKVRSYPALALAFWIDGDKVYNFQITSNPPNEKWLSEGVGVDRHPLVYNPTQFMEQSAMELANTDLLSDKDKAMLGIMFKKFLKLI